MTKDYYGPFIHIHFNANELSEGHTFVQLPDGYSYERIFINNLVNIDEINTYITVKRGDRLTFPPVNSKSPALLYLFIPDVTKPADIKLTIEKFGQIPYPDYFTNPFEPILVTGDKGKKYKVIPSDQFK